MKKILLLFLTLAFGLFLADASLSLLDDTLIVTTGHRALSGIRGFVSFLTLMSGLALYLLMGLTPMIPKRFFLPIAALGPLSMLLVLPLSVYHFARIPVLALVLSCLQALVGVGVLVWMRSGFQLESRLVPERLIGDKGFDWRNSAGFALINAAVVLPGVALYLAWCASIAVDHFSGSFLALRSDGVSVFAKQYVRGDGKAVHLVPMMHIGEPAFYKDILDSFPTNSTILLEGVTDHKNLLEKKLSYKKVAASLGLAEQQDEFEPTQARSRRADVDVGQFSPKSIEFLKTATLLHSEGLTPEVLLSLIQKSQDPQLSANLMDDILNRRNEHLFAEIIEELRQAQDIVVPWGAAHMMGISKELQKAGFTPSSSREYKVLHYRTVLKGLAAPGR